MKQKQEFRKGFEWFRTLTKKQQKRFRLGCHREIGVELFTKAMNDVDDFHTFLSCRFTWYDSKQGYEYWNQICDKF